MKYDGRLYFQFVHHPGGGTPSPSHNTFTGAMSFRGSTQWLVPGPFLGGVGVPQSWPGGTPHSGIGYAWTGYATGSASLGPIAIPKNF